MLWQLLNENSGIWALIGTFLGVGFPILLYVIKSSNSLTRVETNLENYCKEATKDRANLWVEHAKLREAHSDHGERISRVETKLELETHQHAPARGRAAT